MSQSTRRSFLRKSTATMCGLAIASPLRNGPLALATDEHAPSLLISPQIPSVAWQQQSDWLNVRTFGAKADNIADDTLAIHKAVSHLSGESSANKPRHSCVLYFPAGTYRLSRTLMFGPYSGVWLVGHG